MNLEHVALLEVKTEMKLKFNTFGVGEGKGVSDVKVHYCVVSALY